MQGIRFAGPAGLIITFIWMLAVIANLYSIWYKTKLQTNTKITWTILIVAAPFIGLLIYVMFGKYHTDQPDTSNNKR